jgi:hypothetical protein
MFVVNSFDFAFNVSNPDAFVSFVNGQKGKLHSMLERLSSLHVVCAVSLRFGSIGFT